ncbi:MAG: hypothetical protein IT259_04810 [Saprospiraceae bacterium]|nr:hypothetical protein [Saprospiraceae bacterium]
MNLQDIRNLIWHDDMNGAMQALFNRVQEGEGHNQRLRDDLIILNRRFEDLKRKESLGALSADEVRKENTLLTSALLNLIDEMETGKPAQAPLDSPPGNLPGTPEKWEKTLGVYSDRVLRTGRPVYVVPVAEQPEWG